MSSDNTVWVLKLHVGDDNWIVGNAYTSIERAERAQRQEYDKGRSCEIAPAKLNR